MHYKTLYKTCTNKNIHKISTKKIPNKTKLKIHIKKTKIFVKIKRTYKINSYVPSKQNHSRIQTIKNRFCFLHITFYFNFTQIFIFCNVKGRVCCSSFCVFYENFFSFSFFRRILLLIFVLFLRLR